MRSEPQDSLERFDLALRDYLDEGPVDELSLERLVSASLAEVFEDSASADLATDSEPLVSSDSTPSRASSSAQAAPRSDASLRWWAVGLAASVLLGAAAWALVPSESAAPAEAPAAALAPQWSSMDLVFASGEVRLDGGAARLGALPKRAQLVTQAGRACLANPSWGDLCALEDSSLSFTAARGVDAFEGEVLFDLRQSTQFDWTIVDGELSARGGRFSVSQRDGRTRVEVAEQSLELRLADQVHTVNAGQWIEWTRGDTARRGDSTREATSARFALLGHDELWEASLVAPGELSTHDVSVVAQVQLDGRTLGRTPVLAYLPAGVHELSIEATGFERSPESLTVRAGERFTWQGRLVRVGEASDPRDRSDGSLAPSETEKPASVAGRGSQASRHGDASDSLSAESLLSAARRELRDKRWAAAAKQYRQLRRLHPEGELAHAALVTIGNLELEHLGSPSRAKRAYEAYLKAPGPLAQEARYGLLRSLEGRSGERAQLEDYLRRYPKSAEAGALQQRLDELSAEAR